MPEHTAERLLGIQPSALMDRGAGREPGNSHVVELLALRPRRLERFAYPELFRAWVGSLHQPVEMGGLQQAA